MFSLNIQDQPLIIILGATGTAKTRIAKQLAKEIGASLINCDAFQVYDELHIGVNKTDFKDFSNPHYLFNICKPNCHYSIQNFQKAARAAIKDSWDHNYVPILVGGSVLYALSCLKDYQYSKQRGDSLQLNNLSNQELHAKLLAIDPLEATKTHANNRQRVLRALEIYDNEGISKTQFNLQQSQEYLYKNILIINLMVDIEILKPILKTRIANQFKMGLVQEANQLVSKYGESIQALQAIGYKEIIHGQKLGLSEMAMQENIMENTYKYVKNQIKFLKKIPEIININVDLNNLEIAIKNIKKLFWQ